MEAQIFIRGKMLTQYNQQTAHLLKIVNVLLKTSYLVNHEVDLIKRNKNKNRNAWNYKTHHTIGTFLKSGFTITQ